MLNDVSFCCLLFHTDCAWNVVFPLVICLTTCNILELVSLSDTVSHVNQFPKMSDIKGSTSTIKDICALHKELDEALCPICMDHPHNAVLILCSSYDKGCRSYICDTSYRHSNCLDRYKKLKPELKNPDAPSLPRNSDSSISLNVHTSEVNTVEYAETREHVESQGGGIVETVGSESFQETNALEESNMNLKCPLCRGSVQGWKINKEARQYLDSKHRSCSQESCSFIGNYGELRRHARRVHPTTRPADIDPSRQRAWQRLEHQREYGDIVSAIRSAMPGAIVLGDYAIDNGDALNGEASESGEVGPWWTTLFLFQMINSNSSPRRPISQPRGLSRVWTRHRRSSGGVAASRRNLWGDNLLGMQDEEQDWNPRPRRRRRFNRSRPDEEQR